jgi:formate dehydrogenase major subunit
MPARKQRPLPSPPPAPTSPTSTAKRTPIIQGETILDLLRRNMGPDPVPTLCDAPNLEPFGSCRVCSVEVALQDRSAPLGVTGPSRVMASCHTPVAKGNTSPPTARA